MKEKKIEITFVKANFNELDISEQELIEKAKNAYSNAYAPYSGFLVGASVLLENGEIINGSNQENVAYPSGLCAERVALFYAGAKYPEVAIKTIAISAKSKTFEIDDVVSPCGACRQVMAEYQQKQGQNIRLLLHPTNDEVLIANSVTDLLPFMFNSEKLRKF
ncbi:MAG: cytidine deaminase [Flavobacteriales bacterium]|jgi:cytidine deaminase|nr:cytidine deaminase [Flavobacteriales bacterium]MDP7430499.1 cytidine deaminase [Flavobacteriales bacterium]HJN63205.1 cytidine deaminase [Flavobacteriales bacterium]|tara:strand:+ start:193 stop:681 length:489 start_codon:yes stop_codon:yes gene_type:complete